MIPDRITTMRTVLVTPAKDLTIRNPDTFEKIPAEGAIVDPNNTFWARRIAYGDVLVVEQPQEESQPAAPSPSSNKKR